MEKFKDHRILARRPTLRHCFYRALNHHFTSSSQVELALNQTNFKEVEMRLRNTLKEIDLLLDKQVPLQARLDLIIDDEENFDFPSYPQLHLMNQEDPEDDFDTKVLREKYGALHHVCQGSIRPQRNHFDGTL
jgi:hypothetical protein